MNLVDVNAKGDGAHGRPLLLGNRPKRPEHQEVNEAPTPETPPRSKNYDPT